MEVKTSYFVELKNGIKAWLSVDRKVPESAITIEERPMLIPSDGMVLHKNGTDEYYDCVWLKDSSIEEYEEITQAEYDLIFESEKKI